MNKLSEVNLFQVKEEIIHSTQIFLQQVGQYGLEGLVLWAGVIDKSICHIQEAITPRQNAGQTVNGVYVNVQADELHKINMLLFEKNLRLIAQVHSHPGEAYHSSTDELFPIATELGSLSIVVPDFAKAPISIQQCAIFRLHQEGWVHLPLLDTEDLIKVND